MNSEITTYERCFKTFKSRVQRFYLQHKSKMWYTDKKIKRTLITNNRDRGLYDFVCLFVFNLRFNLDGSVNFLMNCLMWFPHLSNHHLQSNPSCCSPLIFNLLLFIKSPRLLNHSLSGWWPSLSGLWLHRKAKVCKLTGSLVSNFLRPWQTRDTTDTKVSSSFFLNLSLPS